MLANCVDRGHDVNPLLCGLEAGRAIITPQLLRLLRRPHKCTSALLYNTKSSVDLKWVLSMCLRKGIVLLLIRLTEYGRNSVSGDLTPRPINSTAGFEGHPCIGLWDAVWGEIFFLKSIPGMWQVVWLGHLIAKRDNSASISQGKSEAEVCLNVSPIPVMHRLPGRAGDKRWKII